MELSKQLAVYRHKGDKTVTIMIGPIRYLPSLSARFFSTFSQVEDWAVYVDWRFSICRNNGLVAVKYK